MHPTAHHIAILVHDGVKLLDLAGPAEVFEEANRLGADYRIRLLSPTGEQVTSSIGIRVAVDGAVTTPRTDRAPDTLVLPGGDVFPRTPVGHDLVEATRAPAFGAGGGVRLHRRVRPRRASLRCAGLLDGRCATTHRRVAHRLAERHPRTFSAPLRGPAPAGGPRSGRGTHGRR
ncbi:DJ-1/PfpI family protein [Streptomyces sp. NPDC004830]